MCGTTPNMGGTIEYKKLKKQGSAQNSGDKAL